jgi:hypothetical protein
MQVAAAGRCAISESRLIIETIAEYYGHDPHAADASSRVRRDSLDPFMVRLAAVQALMVRSAVYT